MKPAERVAKNLPKVDYLHSLDANYAFFPESTSQEVYKTRTAFRYRFKSEASEGVSEFIWRDLRLTQARDLLVHDGLSVTEVLCTWGTVMCLRSLGHFLKSSAYCRGAVVHIW